MLTQENRQILRELAYRSIRHGLDAGKALEIDISQYPAELQSKKATFVHNTFNSGIRSTARAALFQGWERQQN